MVLFYIPVPDQKTGEAISKTLLNEKLIACANIFPPSLSVYRWNGKVETNSESVMILKTCPSLCPAVTAKIKKLHPYECPCIITIDPVHSNPEFLEWVKKETETI